MVAATPPTAATLKKSLREVSIKNPPHAFNSCRLANTYFYVFGDYLVKKHSRELLMISGRILANIIFTGAAQFDPQPVVEFPATHSHRFIARAVILVS
jgi:hypothetical protein